MKKNILFCIISSIILFSCKKDETTPPNPTPTATVSTFAGSSQGYADGSGSSAQFNIPAGIVKDASGNLYVADRDNHRIRKITPAGLVTTFAGSGTAGFVNGTGTAAQFNQPYGITIDASGNLYIGDRLNYAIRKITPSGVVTTLAGGVNGYQDATGTSAKFDELFGLVADAAGNIFACDFGNSRIRKITPAGVVTTFAGSGSFALTDGTGTSASFKNPFGICIDVSGNFYVGDYYNHAIRKITAAGVVTTIAGNGTSGSANGTGSAASFYQPAGLTVDGSGNIYVCDALNHKIRKVTAAGVVTTFAGAASGNTDGVGTGALFNTPIAACGDFSNNAIYIADFANHRIRKIIIN